MKTYRRTSTAKGWGSPAGGIPYSHYRSIGGFYAPGDEPRDCPEEKTLIAAIVELNREIGGKTITTRKARAIYEDIRKKDKEHHRHRREIETLDLADRAKQKLIDDIDGKIIFKKDTKTDLRSGYPVRDQRVSHGISPCENDPDHVKNGRRQRYKHLDGVPKEELLYEIWLLDFLAGEEDCERADVERRFDSSRRIGALVQCSTKGWWRGQNGSEPYPGKIQRYQTIGGDWIGPTNGADTSEWRWQEYMRFYGPMPLLKRVFDSIYDCPIIKWTIDRAVELGMLDEDAVDDPYEWAKDYLNRALHCVQVEGHKCFRKVNGYLCGRQYYIPGTYRWLSTRYDALGFLSLPDLWDGADTEKILEQAVSSGDILVWETTVPVRDASGELSFRPSGINTAIGIDRWNYGCEVVEIRRQKEEFWRGYSSSTFERLERKMQERKAEAARIQAEEKAHQERIRRQQLEAKEAEERAAEAPILQAVLASLEDPQSHNYKAIVSMRLKEVERVGDWGLYGLIRQNLDTRLSFEGMEVIAQRALELGILVHSEKRGGFHGKNWSPPGVFTGKATSKKPTLAE